MNDLWKLIGVAILVLAVGVAQSLTPYMAVCPAPDRASLEGSE